MRQVYMVVTALGVVGVADELSSAAAMAIAMVKDGQRGGESCLVSLSEIHIPPSIHPEIAWASEAE